MKVETGVLHDQFPNVRVGEGRKPLVVLPGMALDNKKASGLVARSYGHGFRRLADEHTLYIVQRRRGPSAPASTKQLAADYAQVLSHHLGQVRLMGLSTGGLIAQHIPRPPGAGRRPHSGREWCLPFAAWAGHLSAVARIGAAPAMAAAAQGVGDRSGRRCRSATSGQSVRHVVRRKGADDGRRRCLHRPCGRRLGPRHQY